ncbi:probable cytosolic oligopeptidase A [Pollicipes pollicipes]|uniref:probable cytosolic oligopeptidase A n=1 Tax=Pollicipes pollicipes TaxID=41117 RepID=UPI00188558B7|nr:probable cytosolic oligopeptidase A [Pollicipes pollicipes]
MAMSLLRLSRFSPLRRISTYVLFPEVPEDTPETNSLLKTDEPPKYSDLTPLKCHDAVLKLAYQFEYDMACYGDTLEGTSKLLSGEAPITFDDVIGPIERREVPFSYVWSTVKNLYTTNQSMVHPRVFQQIHTSAAKAHVSKYNNPAIYRACLELQSDQHLLSEEQGRVAQKYVRDGRLNGLELRGSDLRKFKLHSSRLRREQAQFIGRVRAADELFRHPVDEYDLVRGVPEPILRKMAQDPSDPSRGPWQVTFEPDVYAAFLRHCPSAAQRLNVWLAHEMRCSNFNRDLSNSTCSEEIRWAKDDIAKLLGYKSHMHKSMEVKMAGKVSVVQSMIASLLAAARPLQEQEMRELNEFASSSGEPQQLEACDVPYWRRRHKLSTCSVDESVTRDYFSFPNVLQFLMELSADLFGVEFRLETSSDVETWHPDVLHYSVWEQGRQVAQLMIDPYQRQGKSFPAGSGWTFTGRHRSAICNTQPISYLNFNFTPPEDATPGGLTFDEVQTLFEKFGRSMMTLLCTVEHADVSAPNNMEWDAVDVVPYVFRYWLRDPANVQRVSRHHGDGGRLPEQTCRELIAADGHMIGHDLCRELYQAQLDLKLQPRGLYQEQLDLKLHLGSRNLCRGLYQAQLDLKLHPGFDLFHRFDLVTYVLIRKEGFWLHLQQELYSQFLPFKLHPKDAHTMSFTQSLAQEWGAGVYASLWARMIAADAAAAFHETGGEPDQLRSVGKRFRDTYLASGGAVHPSEVFRRFRGRDPTCDALIRLLGLHRIGRPQQQQPQQPQQQPHS